VRPWRGFLLWGLFLVAQGLATAVLTGPIGAWSILATMPTGLVGGFLFGRWLALV
jgi:hypothetical protein